MRPRFADAFVVANFVGFAKKDKFASEIVYDAL